MEKVLIIDDSLFQRRNIRKILLKKGYEVLEASSGKGGIEAMEAHKPDCVLLDILMPEMDGLAVLEELQKRESGIPVIVITADIQDSTKEECLKRGAVDVFYKPLPTESHKLLEIVERILHETRGNN